MLTGDADESTQDKIDNRLEALQDDVRYGLLRLNLPYLPSCLSHSFLPVSLRLNLLFSFLPLIPTLPPSLRLPLCPTSFPSYPPSFPPSQHPSFPPSQPLTLNLPPSFSPSLLPSSFPPPSFTPSLPLTLSLLPPLLPSLLTFLPPS